MLNSEREMYSISLITSDYRGDHATDVRLDFAPIEDETIDKMIQRVGLSISRPDHIEIRLLHNKGEDYVISVNG